MDEQAETLARAIGARVKLERTLRGWTLDQLAEHAAVSRRMVVNVEQGSVNPSVGTLLRLSDALGVGLPALVEPPTPRSAKVTRAGEGAALWTGAHGGRGVLVAGTEPPDVVELWDWTLGPGDRHDSEAHSAGTRELLQVLEGTVTVESGGTEHVLRAGDALTFFGDTDHAYANLGDLPARFALCVYEPGVGQGHRTEAPDA
jgi:transcriptional regulator with XRE-family HTH domain